MTEDKLKRIEEALGTLRELYPDVAPLFNARKHHLKIKYAGVFGIAVVACELVQVVLG